MWKQHKTRQIALYTLQKRLFLLGRVYSRCTAATVSCNKLEPIYYWIVCFCWLEFHWHSSICQCSVERAACVSEGMRFRAPCTQTLPDQLGSCCQTSFFLSVCEGAQPNPKTYQRREVLSVKLHKETTSILSVFGFGWNLAPNVRKGSWTSLRTIVGTWSAYLESLKGDWNDGQDFVV